jgi:Protein of unknown function (DUF3043)
VILSRRPGTTAATPDATTDSEPPTVGKGRPTPKRSDARKTRRGPAPTNRKEAAAAQRERNRAQRRTTRQALVTGDERNLPPRDAGPERRLARDVVDSRFTLGQVLFLLIFADFVLSLVHVQTINFIADVAALLSLTAMTVDGARNGRRAKLAVIEKFGMDEARGISSYAFMRSLLPRRFRRPPPKVKRGEPVR